MARIMFASALALGAVLATSGFATAAEPTQASTSGFTMTLGGKGTAAEAATSPEDTELTWGYRGYYGGYRGYYGWGGGWGGYRWGVNRNYLLFHPFRPFVNVRKAVFNPYYYGPGYYGGYYGGYGGWGGGYRYGGGYGGYCVGINGTEQDTSAPAISLNLAAAKNPFATAAPPSTEPEADGTFRYDGGPANPIPLPKPDATPKTTAVPPSPGLPVSLKKETPSSPYRYKAYGEK